MYRKKNRRKGQGLVEYALLIGLIAVVGIAAMTFFSSTLNDSLIMSINQVISNASDYIAEGLNAGGGSSSSEPAPTPPSDGG